MIKESKYTPGPWCVGEVCEDSVYNKDGELLAECRRYKENGRKEGVANARIMAASLNLLKALKKAEGFISGFEDDKCQEGMAELLDEIRGAIAQAE